MHIIEIIRQVVEQGFGDADMTTIDRLVHPDVIEHQFGRPSGIEALKRSIQSLANGFPDRKYNLERHSIDGDIVWAHYLFTGTHSGEFAGFAATGTKVSIQVMDIVKIKDGQIVEHWGIPDRFALLSQLGIIKQPAASSVPSSGTPPSAQPSPPAK